MTYREAIRLLGSGPHPRRRIGRAPCWRPRPGRRGSRPISARCRASRHRLGGAARRPRRSESGPAEAALPARARRQAAGRGPNRQAMSILDRFIHPPAPRFAPLGTEAAARLAAIHASAFARGWSTLDFERLLAERGVVTDGLFLGRAAKPDGLRPVADRARRSGDPHGRHRHGGARAGAMRARSSSIISTRSRAGALPACISRSRRAMRRRSRSTAACTSRPPGGGKAITASPMGRGSRR